MTDETAFRSSASTADEVSVGNTTEASGVRKDMASFITSLEDLWKKGQLKDLEEDLDAFIRTHLPDLRRAVQEGQGGGAEVARRRYLRGEISDRQLVDFCVRAILRKRGTCNPRRDIEVQREEIEKEVWYEGERFRRPIPPEKREEIARQWAAHHASHWREWRLFQLLYVWEKKADDYVRLIANP